MANQVKIIGIVSSKLPYKLANQLYNEFDDRFREALYLIRNYSYYKPLGKDLRLVEILLALSIFHKRVITNLDALVKFQKSVSKNSKASTLLIGGYEFDKMEKNKVLEIIIGYNHLRARFGLTDNVFEYHETKDFLNQIIKLKRSFGKRY